MKAYVISSATIGISQYIGAELNFDLGGWTAVQNVASHAMVGGVSAVLQGGKFGHGFVSSLVTASMKGFMNPKTGTYADAVRRTAIAGAVGGTVSKLTGGKFANGAVTSAMQWWYNAEGNPGKSGSWAKPMGYKAEGFKRMVGRDGKYYWGDPLSNPSSYGNSFMAEQVGESISDYETTTDSELSSAVGVAAGILALPATTSALVVSTGVSFYSWLLVPNTQNALGVVLGPLGRGASYIYKPLGQTLDYIGTINTAAGSGIPQGISNNYVEKRD
ncbi:hypothetical protein [Pseudoalteromonas arctica]|uniref:Uncharacterized protein n=1 Tax=Pseudoalteromonas arctica TaxID=394751 RepID=A0A7Y0HBJ3_9GAMM|nr:hypothetical protein [Pseudoalteromonas arctica]NMM41706.1 hypothetical protein [Pseudoalteromonas arctica]